MITHNMTHLQLSYTIQSTIVDSKDKVIPSQSEALSKFENNIIEKSIDEGYQLIECYQKSKSNYTQRIHVLSKIKCTTNMKIIVKIELPYKHVSTNKAIVRCSDRQFYSYNSAFEHVLERIENFEQSVAESS